jgi:HD-like signal output (HDOD) protein
MKKRILFVEDNPLLLQMYAMMLDDERDVWDVVTAGDARQAMALIDDSVFDVVVSDMHLREENGIELMAEVKKRSPASSRIILAGYSDQEEFSRSMDATHQFLAKPFDVKTLKATLARIAGLDAFLKNERIKALASQLNALPSFPSLYVEIMKELNAEDPSIENITAVISLDPSMTAKILQVVNSAVFGLAHKISSPAEAVMYLGIGMVRSLAISAHIFSRFDRTHLKGMSVSQLWEHSMKSALLARSIMRLEKAEASDVEDAYTAGMLHDIGKLMLADNLPAHYKLAVELAGERQISLHEAEFEIFGATHAGAAGYLLGLWGLPAPIVEAVAFHHSPHDSNLPKFGPLAAVHAADVLEHQLSKAKTCGIPAKLEGAWLSAIGLQSRFDAWRSEAEKPVHF